MLKIIRKYSRSWFIWLAIGGIIAVFIFWGVGSFQSPRFQEVALVNGQPILLTAYHRQYTELVKQYQEQNRGEFTEEMAKAMRLKETALNRLIDQLLERGTRIDEGLIGEFALAIGAFLVDPDWTEDDFKRLHGYVREKEITHTQFTILTPLPGTQLYQQRRAELLTGDYSCFDTLHAVVRERSLAAADVAPSRRTSRRRPIAFSSSTSCEACQKKRYGEIVVPRIATSIPRASPLGQETAKASVATCRQEIPVWNAAAT